MVRRRSYKCWREMSTLDLDRALEAIRGAGDRAHFVGPRSKALVDAAERALGLRFPPRYRRFAELLGAGSVGGFEVYGVVNDNFERARVPDGIWATLEERRNGLPHP